MPLLLIAGIVFVCFGLVIARGAPYVPTHRRQLDVAFRKLYPLSRGDVLLDLGSGDGVVLRKAASYGAAAIGYELNPLLVAASRILSWRDNKIAVHERDYLLVKRLPKEVTVVYAFTTSHSIESIGRKCQQWRASRENQLYFISYGFTLKEKKPLRTVGPMHLYLYK